MGLNQNPVVDDTSWGRSEIDMKHTDLHNSQMALSLTMLDLINLRSRGMPEIAARAWI